MPFSGRAGFTHNSGQIGTGNSNRRREADGPQRAEPVAIWNRTVRAKYRGIIGRVTAPPGAPKHTSDDQGLAPQQPSTTAFDLLSRAQTIADVLRSEVEAEVCAMRKEAVAEHDEARRLLSEASSVHENALSAERSALARLKEAREESAQLVADAADQATLVATAANLTTENLLASTQAEADEVRRAARSESERLRVQATTELEQARAKNSALLSESATGIETRQTQATAELRAQGEQASQESDSIRAAAEKFSTEAISSANAEAGAAHALTRQELDQARSEVAELRSTAANESATMRDAAIAEAGRVLREAAEHMNWTQDTIAALLQTAEAEAERVRQADLEASSVHLASRRRQLQDVISRVTLRVRNHLAEATAEAARLRAQASAILEAADKDTIVTRDRALAHAERVIAEADLTAQAATKRGQRRLDEAESGARLLRERAAAAVSQLQTDAHEHRRAVRGEATATLAAARADADASRAEARSLLTQARAEVKVLADRRDDITQQLGNLTGVIEALAVPESPGRANRLPAAAPDGSTPGPESTRPHLSLSTNATTGTR